MCAPNRLNFSSLFVGSGRYPTRLQNQMNRNSVPMNGNHLAAIESGMFPRVMLFRISEYSTSTAVWILFGRVCIRRAIHIIVTTVSMAEMNR